MPQLFLGIIFCNDSGRYTEYVADIKITDSQSQAAKSTKKRYYDRRVVAAHNGLAASGRKKTHGSNLLHQRAGSLFQIVRPDLEKNFASLRLCGSRCCHSDWLSG
jgi:hypothetical protein